MKQKLRPMHQSTYKKDKLAQQGMKPQTLVIATLIILAVIISIVLIAYYSSANQAVNTPPTAAPVNFPYDTQPVLGNPAAPVKIVEFGDFKCPSCKNFKENMMPQIKKDLIDTGLAKLYFINDPIIAADSVTAGIAGESIFHQKPEAFWTFYDAIYDNQDANEQKIWATPEFLVNLAKKIKLPIDFDLLQKDLDNKVYEKDVTADRQLANQVGANSTPTLFINGIKYDNIFDYNGLKAAVLAAGKGTAK